MLPGSGSDESDSTTALLHGARRRAFEHAARSRLLWPGSRLGAL